MDAAQAPHVVSKTWFERDAPVVAPELLNKLIVSRIGGVVVRARIIEVEAYTQDDPASHTFTGPTPRNRAMFGPPGQLYMYLSYGIHCCANVVTGPAGSGQAVLLRAVAPVDGVDEIRIRRGGQPDRELANGPGKLAQALGLDLSHYGLDLTEETSIVTVQDDGVTSPKRPVIGPRVGLSRAVDTPWRFRVP